MFASNINGREKELAKCSFIYSMKLHSHDVQMIVQFKSNLFISKTLLSECIISLHRSHTVALDNECQYIYID